jgi:tetratricopeptide (TPR) repeat protein
MMKIRSTGCLPFLAAVILVVLSFSPEAFAGTCEQPVAVAVSVQGDVNVKQEGQEEWIPVRLKDTFCPGDTVRAMEHSRADLLLANETTLRIDQTTEIVFTRSAEEKEFWLDVLLGGAYFMSRTPHRFKVETPFLNAGVEGTEFSFRVEKDKAFLTLFEGRLAASNDLGKVTLSGGQSVLAEAGKPPGLQIVARPRDAVQWTLFYPPVVEPIPGVPPDWRSRASDLLSVGRVDEARGEIDEVLKTAPSDADALSLQAVIAVAQNEKENALDLAKKAVSADPKSATARIALSYAQQADFDLEGALSSLQEAVKSEPGNALGRARLSELLLSFGFLGEALDEARKAATQNPDVARTQTVLGFAYLAQINTKDSRAAFEKAIELDQADPLPRLGLGLATIREGDVEAGRAEIEIAASLDPNNSIIRSYLAKAYYEEKRDVHAASQFTMAKEFDPNDPTPFFYDAIRKQTLNRPVEALGDMQKAISLNDNRAIYRSRLLLDDDLAVRSASLGRIFSDLGFQQLALVEGWKSVNTDPANYSAHRFLADSYASAPRHEIARVSELLQSQLLQPNNINPVQPSLAQSNLFILEGAGPSAPSFNEFNPLFNRNRFALQASGVVGNNDTLGEEIVHSAVWNRYSYSLGQFHFETDGFRENNDQEQDIYNLFGQASLSHRTSIQAELRATEFERGDLTLNFFPDDILSEQRLERDGLSARFGFHYACSPGTDVIGTFTYQSIDLAEINSIPPVFSLDKDTDEENVGGEIQFLHRSDRYNVVGGGGYFTTDEEIDETTVISPPPPPPPIPPIPPMVIPSRQSTDVDHTNAYVYSQVHFPRKVTWTLGASADFFRGRTVDRDQVNPKAGVIWSPVPSTTLRAAVFRVLKRSLINNQTLEPTQVAGFNQFFDDTDGTDSWRYGLAIDRKFTATLFGGAEYTRRDLEVPFTRVTGSVRETLKVDWEEQEVRAYMFLTPHPWLSLSIEYLYEKFDRDKEFVAFIENVETHRVPIGIGFFHPCGFFSRLRGTYFDQKGNFERKVVPAPGTFSTGSDDFFVVDASLGYRLPKRYGIFTVEARNLFDESFRYQDTDPVSPVLQPERSVFFKITVAL